MSSIPSSIWNQDKFGKWKLYFNTEPDISFSNKIEKKNVQKNANIPDNKLIQGTLVMTPKGIGRLIKSLDDIGYIRFNQEVKEEQFPLSEISNIFTCYITIMRKENMEKIRLKLPVEGTVQNIFEELSKLKKINDVFNDYSLIYNKNRLNNNNSFDQIKIENNAKILLLSSNEVLIEKQILRFGQEGGGWFYNINNDAICFSPSEDIKLLGASVYCLTENSSNNNMLTGYLKVFEGQSCDGKVLVEESTEIPTAPNNTNMRKKIKFKKYINCKKNMYYTISIFTSNSGRAYCGLRGKAVVEGEDGVNFTFKRVNGRNALSSTLMGNFPELFYCHN